VSSVVTKKKKKKNKRENPDGVCKAENLIIGGKFLSTASSKKMRVHLRDSSHLRTAFSQKWCATNRGSRVATSSSMMLYVLIIHHVAMSHEKTLSFFRLFRSVRAAKTFRSFLSTQTAEVQNSLLLFLTSGLRWRFFLQSSKGCTCPACGIRFWSWEHFVTCPTVLEAPLLTHLTQLVISEDWAEIAALIRATVHVWRAFFDHDDLTDFVRNF
jgi:hypothetical protein